MVSGTWQVLALVGLLVLAVAHVLTTEEGDQDERPSAPPPPAEAPPAEEPSPEQPPTEEPSPADPDRELVAGYVRRRKGRKPADLPTA